MTFASLLRGMAGIFRNRRARTLLVIAFVGLMIGEFTDTGVDDLLRVQRDTVRRHAAGQQIVVVAIDDRSLAGLAKWPWPRRLHAGLVDELNRLGAREIYFDINFYAPAAPAEDHALDAAIRGAAGKVTLATRYTIDPMTQQRTDFLPLKRFRDHGRMGTIDVDYDTDGAVRRLPFGLPVAGVEMRSFASLLSGVQGPSGADFPIDFAISPFTVPTVSAIDLIQHRVPRAQIAGRAVVIGVASMQIGDVWRAPGYGMVPGVYFQVLGAHTLRAGVPVDLPWWVMYLGALAVAALGCALRDATKALPLLGAALVGTLLGPLALERHGIVAITFPALFVVAATLAARLWWLYQLRLRLRGTTNVLTGLANLNALREGRGARPDAGAPLVVARVRNFAEVVSTLPPDAEKVLVEQIAARLTPGEQKDGIHQGDEGIFAWFLRERALDAISDHLDALHALFRLPVTIAGRSVDLSLSFGVDTDASRTPMSRLGSALVAADEAVQEGARWKLYDPDKLKEVDWKLSLLGQLDAAIDDGSVWVAFQPKLDLKRRAVVGAEALVRWTHPTKGMIPPDQFIIAAEQNDRIEKLTMHVLDRAVRAAATINGHGIAFEIAVNLSTRLFAVPDLPAAIGAVLARHGLPAERLTLEVTETAAFGDGDRGHAVLAALRAMGIGISIDDYGTGNSTLHYLRNLPANEIKIDRSFVQGVARSASDRLLVSSTIALAHSLGHRVVAEGIETREALDALEEMGCDEAQGYFIGRPMRFVALSRMLLRDRLTARAA